MKYAIASFALLVFIVFTVLKQSVEDNEYMKAARAACARIALAQSYCKNINVGEDLTTKLVTITLPDDSTMVFAIVTDGKGHVLGSIPLQ